MSRYVTCELPGIRHSMLYKMHKNAKYTLHVPSQLTYGALWWVRPQVLRIFFSLIVCDHFSCSTHLITPKISAQWDNNDSSKNSEEERLIFLFFWVNKNSTIIYFLKGAASWSLAVAGGSLKIQQLRVSEFSGLSSLSFLVVLHLPQQPSYPSHPHPDICVFHHCQWKQVWCCLKSTKVNV